MKRTSTDQPTQAAPVCWQRESTTTCLRVELENGELHILPYNHLIAAHLAKAADGNEELQITFSSHKVQIQGRALRELAVGIQDFAIKWLRAVPERYASIVSGDGVISGIRITSSE